MEFDIRHILQSVILLKNGCNSYFFKKATMTCIIKMLKLSAAACTFDPLKNLFRSPCSYFT